MPKNDRERTRKARALMQERPELNYTQALAEVDAAHAPRIQGIDPVLLAPYPDEDGVVVEELGWRVLAADATPAQKARAEAVWRPVRPDRPCRCSGPCLHGRVCGCDDEDEDSPCTGRLIHVDRIPGSMWGLTAWDDFYECADCGAQLTREAVLPEIPWGELREPEPGSTVRATVVYSGVRHPGFPEISEDTPEHPEGDGSCRSCGAYALSGFLCDGCRGAGWTDYYGMVEEPDHDDPRYLASIGACPECGAGGPGDPYGECDCYLDDGPEDSEPAYEEAR